MAISKVIYAGQTLIDLTNDTVTADKLLDGYTAHGKDGKPIEGTCPYDANTKDATATAAEILKGKTAYKNGSKVTGTMPNNGAAELFVERVDESIPIPQGYHDGSGWVRISQEEADKLVPENIRENVDILGVTGTMSGTEGAKAEAVEITPSNQAQTRLPDSNKGYNYISQVTVKAIPYVETDNQAGGKTVTIG